MNGSLQRRENWATGDRVAVAQDQLLTPWGAPDSLRSYLARNCWCHATFSEPQEILRESRYWRHARWLVALWLWRHSSDGVSATHLRRPPPPRSPPPPATHRPHRQQRPPPRSRHHPRSPWSRPALPPSSKWWSVGTIRSTPFFIAWRSTKPTWRRSATYRASVRAWTS